MNLVTLVFFLCAILVSCSSRKLEKDYRVVDASHKETPEWVEDLEEWIEDNEEEEERANFKYYIYATEPKNSRSMACELAKARSTSNIASEISSFIKQSFAQSSTGGAQEAGLSEYLQDDLAMEVQAFVVGAQSYKTYWEKRRFEKDKGAAKDWDGFVCTTLLKISKENLRVAFQRTQESLSKKVNADNKAKVEKIMSEASEAYTK